MHKKIMISMDEEVYKRLESSAKAEEMTVSAFIRQLFKDWERLPRNSKNLLR
mgnify:CR=1 FL=1